MTAAEPALGNPGIVVIGAAHRDRVGRVEGDHLPGVSNPGTLIERIRMGIEGGMLIANPVGQDNEIEATIMRGHIEAALNEAKKNGVTGKAVTPFLLDRLSTMTEGASLKTNIALVRNNSRLAAAIAVAMAQTP